jgi:hypothetical protein
MARFAALASILTIEYTGVTQIAKAFTFPSIGIAVHAACDTIADISGRQCLGILTDLTLFARCIAHSVFVTSRRARIAASAIRP